MTAVAMQWRRCCSNVCCWDGTTDSVMYCCCELLQLQCRKSFAKNRNARQAGRLADLARDLDLVAKCTAMLGRCRPRVCIASSQRQVS